MKNKNYLKIGVAVMLSAILLITVAVTGNAAGSGYEQLKMLLHEEPVHPDNMTVHMDMEVSDNGKAVLQAVGDVKADKAAEKMSGQFELSGKTDKKAIEIFKNGDTVLFRLTGSEKWYQTTARKNRAGDEEKINRHFKREGSKENPEVAETILDTLMGDLKDHVTMEESDGLRTFSLTLDKGNMPVLVQTVFSAAGTHSETIEQKTCDLTGLPAELQSEFADMQEYKDMIDISGNRVLEKIKVSLTVDQKNQPQAMEFSASFSGTAKDGTAHTYDMNCKITLSGLNTTIPDEAKADPASIIKIDPARFESK